MGAGRPTDYTMDLVDKICERVACGESMRSICRDDSMPVMTTMFRWLRERPEFKQQYEIAKEESAEAWAEDIVYIADNEASQPLIKDGVPIEIDGEILKVTDAPSVAHARLRVDARKWAASKLKPKKYGDKIQNENVNVEMTHEQWLETLK